MILEELAGELERGVARREEPLPQFRPLGEQGSGFLLRDAELGRLAPGDRDAERPLRLCFPPDQPVAQVEVRDDVLLVVALDQLEERRVVLREPLLVDDDRVLPARESASARMKNSRTFLIE